jgi:RHS repeat-associated protein
VGFGLYYYNARYYDPVVGTFLSPDTLIPDPTIVWDYNRFGYVRGNPLKYNDPSGHATGPAIHDSNGGPSVPLSNELFLKIQDDYYALGVAWEDLPSDVRKSYEAGGVHEYTEPHGGASAQYGWKDPATVASSAFGAFRLGKLALQLLGLSCGDGDCGNEARTSYQIGEEGAQRVWRILNDPSLQTEVRVYVSEGGKRANYFARFDGLTDTAIHEVKNVSNLSLTQGFMNQATTYKRIADGMNLEVHYWLVNSAPPKVINWLQQQGIIVHTDIP